MHPGIGPNMTITHSNPNLSSVFNNQSAQVWAGLANGGGYTTDQRFINNGNYGPYLNQTGGQGTGGSGSQGGAGRGLPGTGGGVGGGIFNGQQGHVGMIQGSAGGHVFVHGYGNDFGTSTSNHGQGQLWDGYMPSISES